MSVRVSLDGQDVTTGSVVVTSAAGSFDLVFDTADGGRWRGNAPAYDEVYVLDVVSGEDTVDGVRVDGPDIHVFVEPLPGATIDSTMPLLVRWGRDDEAATASIDTEELDTIAITDTGEFSLPAGSLKAESDKAKENTLRITRTNRVTPSGAAAGSEWEVSIRNEIEVLAAPNPAL